MTYDHLTPDGLRAELSARRDHLRHIHSGVLRQAARREIRAIEARLDALGEPHAPATATPVVSRPDAKSRVYYRAARTTFIARKGARTVLEGDVAIHEAHADGKPICLMRHLDWADDPNSEWCWGDGPDNGGVTCGHCARESGHRFSH
jgi:hypothetical protein